MLMVVVPRILLLCAALLAVPTVATAQCTSPFAVQRVWTQDAGGIPKTTFASGEVVQLAAEVNSIYGGPGDTQLAIATSFYNDNKTVNIPIATSTWTWNTAAPTNLGDYPVAVQVLDRFCGAWVQGNTSFTVQPPIQGEVQLPPTITDVQTFREGDFVFFRLFYTDPNGDAEGFGFRGANGVGWAEETHPFSSPSNGRVSPGIVEYPFNHLCDTGPAYESDVEL